MNEERPIVFTISDEGNGVVGVKTKDPRGEHMNGLATRNILFSYMAMLTSEFNNNGGYAVLFEVY